MGVNNRARRAAKRRKQTSGGDRQTARSAPGAAFSGASFDDLAGRISELATRAFDLCAEDPRRARVVATELLEQRRVPVDPLVDVLLATFTSHLSAVVRGGWSPSDLVEITRRRLGDSLIPTLSAALAVETASHPTERVTQAWRDDLATLPEPGVSDLSTVGGVARLLSLAGVLFRLPFLEVIVPLLEGSGRAAGPARPASQAAARQLARVRALLAKAESTSFPDEAEALSAKAQELVSRHALDRLLADDAAGDGSTTVVPRRLWLDAPYVLPKATLVDQVASANRCRTVMSEHLGFATIVGESSDIDAVELLATSLLVQADSAMLRHGSHTDAYGTSRTASFRRSFLLAYAWRIGERLRAATEQAAEQTTRPGDLVPLLVRHEAQVEAAFDAMFPQTTSRRTTVGNRQGYAAGRAAADLAVLEVSPELTDRTG